MIECFSKLGDLIITNGDTGRAAGLYYVEDYIAKVNYFIKNNQKTLQSNAEIVSLKVVTICIKFDRKINLQLKR